MAKQPGLDFQSAKGGLGELKRRLLFVIGALIVFRIGSFIPIPGIDATVLAKLLEQQRGTIIEMFNMFSGGALSRASIFALGIMPYISASIIIQLLTVVHPALAEIKKEGEAGRRKISQYTRYGTLVLAIFQSIGIATGLPNMPGMQGLVLNPGFAFYFTAVVSLVTGTMFLMWLGEQITERGIGNGISIIIFAGIVAGLPPAVAHTIEQARQGDLHFLLLLLVAVLVFAVTFFVVFIERGQRRIVVNYAKRQQGRRVYAAQSTHLPLKVNMAGVIPAIFASSIILFPATIASWFGGSYVTLRLRSGEMRKVPADCRATLGEVGNAEHMLRVLGKAGAARWRGVRPTVRGTAMNPVDHPHGGGEGRNFGKHPVTPWGVQTKGKKTRSNKRTDKFIVRRRSKK